MRCAVKAIAVSALNSIDMRIYWRKARPAHPVRPNQGAPRVSLLGQSNPTAFALFRLDIIQTIPFENRRRSRLSGVHWSGRTNLFLALRANISRGDLKARRLEPAALFFMVA